MENTLNTIDYGKIRIVDENKTILKEREYETIDGSHGEQYVIRITSLDEVVAVLLDEDEDIDENLIDLVDYNDIYNPYCL